MRTSKIPHRVLLTICEVILFLLVVLQVYRQEWAQATFSLVGLFCVVLGQGVCVLLDSLTTIWEYLNYQTEAIKSLDEHIATNRVILKTLAVNLLPSPRKENRNEDRSPT